MSTSTTNSSRSTNRSPTSSEPSCGNCRSRAERTATRFVNEYNYGDFRGNPEEATERYFDAFCYLANWGTRRLMFRSSPRALLDAETARKYCHTDYVVPWTVRPKFT